MFLILLFLSTISTLPLILRESGSVQATDRMPPNREMIGDQLAPMIMGRSFTSKAAITAAWTMILTTRLKLQWAANSEDVITPGDILIPSDNSLVPNALIANDKWVKIEEPLNPR